MIVDEGVGIDPEAIFRIAFFQFFLQNLDLYRLAGRSVWSIWRKTCLKECLRQYFWMEVREIAASAT